MHRSIQKYGTFSIKMIIIDKQLSLIKIFECQTKTCEHDDIALLLVGIVCVSILLVPALLSVLV